MLECRVLFKGVDIYMLRFGLGKCYTLVAKLLIRFLDRPSLLVQRDSDDDKREEYTPGWKYSEWEMRGIPMRIEIGPKDIEKNQVVLVSRVDREKRFVSIDSLEDSVKTFLDDIQNKLFEKAKKFRDEHIKETENLSEFKEFMKEGRGFIKAPWCGEEACELKIKEETTATIRTIGDKAKEGQECIVCGKPAKHVPYFAKSY